MNDSELEAAIARAHVRMNALNAKDPTSLDTPDGPRPRELVMAERLEAWVLRVAASAGGKNALATHSLPTEGNSAGEGGEGGRSDGRVAAVSAPLLLAARGQHLMRWTMPRSDYGEGRTAYLQWRKDLSKMHAKKVSAILKDEGFDEDVIEATRTINLKQGIKTNPDVQTMEDALCLSFLEHEFAEFCEKYDDEKVLRIVKKTWAKMSPFAHDLALQLAFDGRARDLILVAVTPKE